VEKEVGIVVMCSQEKWERLRQICRDWLSKVMQGQTEMNFKQLRSDRGFLVYVTQAYPAMKPYLKGFHLSLESWRGGRDAEGWKCVPGSQEQSTEETKEGESEGEADEAVVPQSMEEWKMEYVAQEGNVRADGPSTGITFAVPRFKEDLEALVQLTSGTTPTMRCVRSKRMLTAYYGFGDASGSGFGATVQRGNGIYGRYGLWGRDAEDQSSNYRELRNLVEAVEEEAQVDYLKDGELWIFTDNSTAESCFFKGGSSSKLLHALVLRLRQAEMRHGFNLHVVHVAGTRMIEQGTNGLSRGSLLEGVMTGRDMISYVDLALTAFQRHSPVVGFVKSWVIPTFKHMRVLSAQEWFVEGHGIVGGSRDNNGMWIPRHAPNGHAYLWMPPPVLADVALEECLRAVHKRTDAVHIFLIPRLYSPLWIRMFHKLSDFIFKLSPGSVHWPHAMHEPLFVGISLPLLSRDPWTLRRSPLLVAMERDLRRVLSTGEADGRDILCKLLRTPRRLASLPADMARKVLRMSGSGEVPSEGDGG
jgi:hypothetical protein